MLSKDFKILFVATGIGFFFGLITVGFFNIRWLNPVFA